jgi:hypothetical protein
MMRNLTLIMVCLALGGCKLFDGLGSDKSKLVIDHRCDVELSQAARAGGDDDSDVMETIKVLPDCTTEIQFRQVVGDSVREIESPGTPGGMQAAPVVELPPEQKEENP